MSHQANRASQLRHAFIQLNERKLEKTKKKQPKLEIGSFVFGSSHVEKLHTQTFRALSSNFKNDIIWSSLGFEVGACSFVDCLIGVKQCYVNAKTSESLFRQKCLYLLVCRFANIYVVGEFSYFDSNAYSLPGIESVDKFKNKQVRNLENAVVSALAGAGCERVYASELDCPIPNGIKVESNLVVEEPLLFDGYFSWMD